MLTVNAHNAIWEKIKQYYRTSMSTSKYKAQVKLLKAPNYSKSKRNTITSK